MLLPVIVKFYRNDAVGGATVVRTEYCESYIEADVFVEEEEGHFDFVKIVEE